MSNNIQLFENVVFVYTLSKYLVQKWRLTFSNNNKGVAASFILYTLKGYEYFINILLTLNSSEVQETSGVVITSDGAIDRNLRLFLQPLQTRIGDLFILNYPSA